MPGLTGEISFTTVYAKGWEKLLNAAYGSFPVLPGTDLRFVTDKWYMPEIIMRGAYLVGYNQQEGDRDTTMTVSWHAKKIERIHRNLFTRFVYFLWRTWRKLRGK